MKRTTDVIMKCFKLGFLFHAALIAIAVGYGALDSKAFAEPAKDDLVDSAMRKELLGYLEDINQYILGLDLGSDSLKIENKNDSDSLYVNGNFARVLVASSRITGNKAYLREAVRWCDAVYNKQELAITSNVEEGGFWVDFASAQNIYFGDAGTGSTAMAIIYRETDDPQRKRLYRAAMDRYARFVMQGTLVDPQRKDRKTTKTWIIAEGPDKGALGCGYYRGHLSVAPYTISTATTGGAFFSHFYEITRNPEYKQVAANAVKWIFTARKPDGELRYNLDNRPEKEFSWPLDTIAYCAEAYITADKYLGDGELKQQLRREAKPTVEWLLKNQNDDGSWGKMRSADQQRSPGAVALLSWYYRQVERDPKVAESVRKYCRFLLNPENSAKYGVKQLIRTTGFVGLVVADIIQPESIF
jgi:hypothetical protein